MFTALSENFGNLRAKLHLFVAMAPVVQLRNNQNEFLKTLADDIDSITWWMDFFGIDELFGPNWVLASKVFCVIKPDWCNQANEFADLNRKPLYEDESIPTQDQIVLNPLSSKQLLHYGQIIKNQRFMQFDYYQINKNKNTKKYGGSRKYVPDIPL
jgi:hypothetical protein